MKKLRKTKVNSEMNECTNIQPTQQLRPIQFGDERKNGHGQNTHNMEMTVGGGKLELLP